MAKRITSGKREREKLKQTKRQDKQKKKEERLSGGSRSFEDMLAYVDENGVLHTTPQDVKPKEEIDASQIEISVPRQSEIEEEEPMSGLRIFQNREFGAVRVIEYGGEERPGGIFHRIQRLRLHQGCRRFREILFSHHQRPGGHCRRGPGDVRTRTRHAGNECSTNSYQ